MREKADHHKSQSMKTQTARCWYHGSPKRLAALRKGSWVTPFKELAKAFAHKPTLISQSDDGQTVKHNGRLRGFLYVVSEPVGPEDVSYLPDTGQTHWQTQRDLQVALVAELPLDDPPQLSEAEIAELGKRLPEGRTGYRSDSDGVNARS